MSAWLWLAAGIVLAALEMVVSGVYLLWIGLGGIATGLILLASPALPLTWQLTAFALCAVVAAFAGHWVYRRAAVSDAPSLNRRAEQLIGKALTLDEAIVNGVGRARIGDTIWRVHGPDLPAGSTVHVTGCSGTALIVAAAPTS
jgi:hypothetical protein